MEVGEGSSIAREMGRSWTTHTGAGGAAGTGNQRKKKKNGKKNAKPAWASVEVWQTASAPSYTHVLVRVLCALPVPTVLALQSSGPARALQATRMYATR